MGPFFDGPMKQCLLGQADLKEKRGIENKVEIMYWDDRPGNVANLITEGWGGQLYTDYAGFKEVLEASGFVL